MFQAQWLSYHYNVNVHAQVPDPFILLNQLLLSHVNVKWQLELYDSESMNRHPRLFPNPFDAYQINCISQIIEAANGFSNIQISGTQAEGWCCLWIGNSVTTWEDAKFSFSCGWIQFQKEDLNNFTSNFITTCNSLSATQVHKLMIGSPYPGLLWWKLLGKLPRIEELELYSDSVYTIGAAWRANLAPAVLPALWKVRIVDSFLTGPQQYAVLGDPPVRKIVRLPIHVEDDVASFQDLESAEKKLEDMSKGLLKLLQGLGRKVYLC